MPRPLPSLRLVPVLVALALPMSASIAQAAGPTTAQSAERLAEQAYELHEQGKFADAIATYLKVYEISKAGAVLYNVATIYDRKMHERELAAQYYRRYLGAPDAEPELVKKAAERLETLKKEAEAAPPAAPVPAPPVAPVEPPTVPAPPPPATLPGTAPLDTQMEASSGWRTTGLVVGAVGLGGLCTSAVLGIAAKSRNDQANQVCSGAACSTSQGVTLAHQAGTFATASTATFASGLALVGIGVTVYLVAPRRAVPSSTTATGPTLTLEPLVGPGNAGTMLRGSF